jgi:hypothetical protein
MRGPRLLVQALDLYRLPRITLEISGDERCLELYRSFTRRHHRWRVIRSKTWGVAAMPVPADFDAYLRQPARSHMRKQLNRARRAGYTFGRVDPLVHLGEIMNIHRSATHRQGRPMHPDYLDEGRVRAYFAGSADVYGVFDGAGELRAYRGLRICGRVACGERVLGHADHLDKGIMYLLFAEMIRDLCSTRAAHGTPEWLVYDMFPGASPGMRQFKEWIGFQPHRVTWRWTG